MENVKTLCNPNATAEAKRLMEYISEISGRYVILGQHTLTRKQEELEHIKKITGKLPALCGFELLSYSGNVNWDSCDEACLKELYENMGTIENALEWGRNGGIVTVTWHWYSPLGGKDKSFFTQNTDFDPTAALDENSPEHNAMLRDLDLMAVHLRRFRQENIPVLWRPFHESEGNWFWWSSKGPEAARQLYRFMYKYFTDVCHLDNLIWVWNSPLKEGYPGDDVVDIISRDLYPEAHKHTSLAKQYDELTQITPMKRLCALAEIGTLPDVDSIIEENVPWCWYMTWSGVFTLTEEFTKNEQLLKNYNSKYAVTFDKLPWIKNTD